MTYIPKGWYDEEIARLHRIIEARDCIIEARDRRCEELEAALREILAEVGAVIDRRPLWSSPSKILPPDSDFERHMKVARKIMKKNHAALAELAKR